MISNRKVTFQSSCAKKGMTLVELADMERRLNSASEDALLNEHSYEAPSRLSYYRRLMQRIGPRVCLSVAGFGETIQKELLMSGNDS